jgi:sodium/hydrogen exchanger-like protein 6/7
MKPFLTNSRPTLLETLPSFLTPVARVLTTTEQLNQTGRTRKLDSDSDLCIDESNGGGGGGGGAGRRNSISRVSIRLEDGYMASYKNRE